jgi:hypothetical protein
MKPISTFAVLVYNTGNYLPRSCSNTAIYRLNVGAKSPKEAEDIVKDWLAERKLTARTRPPRTAWIERSISLKYKEIQQVFPKTQELN